LQPNDKDMIVMLHEIEYELNNIRSTIKSSLVVKGVDSIHTAMAKTVGLPVAIAALQILNGNINTPGVQLPINKEVYLPILKELEDFGVVFHEKQGSYMGYNINNVAS